MTPAYTRDHILELLAIIRWLQAKLNNAAMNHNNDQLRLYAEEAEARVDKFFGDKKETDK